MCYVDFMTRPANFTAAKTHLDAAVAADPFAARFMVTIYRAARIAIKAGNTRLAYAYLENNGVEVDDAITESVNSGFSEWALMGRILSGPAKYHAAN